MASNPFKVINGLGLSAGSFSRSGFIANNGAAKKMTDAEKSAIYSEASKYVNSNVAMPVELEAKLDFVLEIDFPQTK